MIWTSIALYILYEVFDTVQIQHMQLTKMATPLELSQLDEILWIATPIGVLFSIAARLCQFAFLIYFGYCTAWYWALALAILAIPPVVTVAAFARLKFGVQLTAITGYLVMPLAGIGMWVLAGMASA